MSTTTTLKTIGIYGQVKDEFTNWLIGLDIFYDCGYIDDLKTQVLINIQDDETEAFKLEKIYTDETRNGIPIRCSLSQLKALIKSVIMFEQNQPQMLNYYFKLSIPSNFILNDTPIRIISLILKTNIQILVHSYYIDSGLHDDYCSYIAKVDYYFKVNQITLYEIDDYFFQLTKPEIYIIHHYAQRPYFLANSNFVCFFRLNRLKYNSDAFILTSILRAQETKNSFYMNYLGEILGEQKRNSALKSSLFIHSVHLIYKNNIVKEVDYVNKLISLY
jgi:hypothetical protein